MTTETSDKQQKDKPMGPKDKLNIFIQVFKLIVDHGPKAVDWVLALSSNATQWWTGKKIAIIGPTASGKNSFFNRLRQLPIPNDHVNTKSLERIPKFTLKRTLPDGEVFSFSVKRSTNVGGEIEQRERFWLDSCNNSDVIFYLMTLDDLRNRRFTSESRVGEDLDWLARNISKMNGKPMICLLVNKIDVELGNVLDFDKFCEELVPLIAELEEIIRLSFGPYHKRYVATFPISMTDESIFSRSLANIMNAISEEVADEK